MSETSVRSLVDAVTAVGGNLDLPQTLRRIVLAASELADARYVALGVIDDDGDGLSEFVTSGLTDDEVRRIGPLPRGHGILGLLITDPQPLRLHDLSSHPGFYGFPPHHPQMTSFLGVPVRVGERVFGNLYLTDKRGGGDFTAADEQAVIALAAAAGVAVQNARLFGTVRRREQWLDATLQIQRAFLRRVDLDTALQLVTSMARTVLEADIAMAVLEQDDATLLVRAIDGGPISLRGTTLRREGALADVVGHAVTVSLAEGLRLPGLDKVASALLVPFAGPTGDGGALLVGTTAGRRGRWLADDDLQALQGFAAQAAIAMDRAQAQEDRAALAVLADRDRIARDLHDVVIQRLFATGLRLQSAVRRAGNADLDDGLRAAVSDLDVTIGDIRNAIFELRHDGVAATLPSQIREIAAIALPTLGLRPEVVTDGPLESAVPDSLRPDIFAVLMESLSNAGRHAAPSRVDVRVALEGSGPDAWVEVRVSDDGRGFVVGGHESGLRNLRERAVATGGDFTIESAPGEGTTVCWRAPIMDREQQAPTGL